MSGRRGAGNRRDASGTGAAVATEVADEEGGVYAKRLYEEAADGVQAHVEQGDIAIFEAVREAPRDEEEYKADEDVPDGLVEKRRVESDFPSEA